jgi:hypothetical protein
VAVMGCPKKGVQSPTPIGGLDFLDMDSLLKYPEIPVLDFLDTLLALASMGLRKLTGAAFVRASRLVRFS